MEVGDGTLPADLKSPIQLSPRLNCTSNRFSAMRIHSYKVLSLDQVIYSWDALPGIHETSSTLLCILFDWDQKQSSLYFYISSGIFTALVIFYLRRALEVSGANCHHCHFKRRKQLHSRRIKCFVQGCWVSPRQNQPKNWVSWLSELYLCSTHLRPKTNESCGFVFWLLVWGNREMGLGNAPPAGISGLVTDIQR